MNTETPFERLRMLRSKVGPECQALLVSRDLIDQLLALNEKTDQSRQPQPGSRPADQAATESEPRPISDGNGGYIGPDCGYAMYGPPALCTCGTCKEEE